MINENALKNDLLLRTHKERFENYKTGGKDVYFLAQDVYDCIDKQTKLEGPELNNEIRLPYSIDKIIDKINELKENGKEYKRHSHCGAARDLEEAIGIIEILLKEMDGSKNNE